MSAQLIGRLSTGGDRRVLRFLVFGGLNTLAGYALYFALVSVGLVFWAANFCCLIFGLCLNFHLQGRYVFQDRDRARFVRFCGGWFCIYLVQTLLIGLLIRAGLSALVAGLVILPGATVASYFIQRFLVFRTGRDRA